MRAPRKKPLQTPRLPKVPVATRSVFEIKAYVQNRLALAELSASTARSDQFRDRSEAVAQSLRGLLEFIDSKTPVALPELNEDQWRVQVKRQF